MRGAAARSNTEAMLLFFGQLAAFGICLSIGLAVKSADVQCSMPVVTVPLPLSQHEAQVPCDGDAPVAAEQLAPRDATDTPGTS